MPDSKLLEDPLEGLSNYDNSRGVGVNDMIPPHTGFGFGID